MELIRLEDITFAYHGRPPVFEGLDFQFSQGERIGLTGPNGAGKSTLFMLAMGLLSPSAGRIYGLGEPRLQEKDFRALRLQLGYCFQDPDDQLFCPTVGEDVAFGPLNQGKKPHEVREIVASTLETLGLAGFGERVTYHLSGGEKRMVSLATVLAMQPRALLLDEPTAGLDTETAARLTALLMESELSWVVISHDQAFLDQTCNKTVDLRGGQLKEN